MAIIKIRDTGKIFYTQIEVLKWRELIQLSGEIPDEIGDFDVLNSNGDIVDYYENFNIIYDIGEDYLQLTNDNKIYYNYLVAENGDYINNIKITTNIIKNKNYFLYQKGQGKKYKEFNIQIFDEDHFPLYKLQNSNLINTSIEEKDLFFKEKAKNKLVYDKQEKITKSKLLLNSFLENRPLISSCHNFVAAEYSASLEKQTLLTNNYLTYTVAKTIDPNAKLTWNAKGEECEEWTEEEYLQLILEMRDYVKPLVSKQQAYEVQIKACETQEELDNILISYE